MAPARSPMRTLMRWLVDERLVLAVITFNLIILFARSFQSMKVHDDFLFALDYVCLVFFMIEMLLKIGMRGFARFWSSGMNRFDFVIVMASAPTLIAPFTELEGLTVVLVFRAGRLLRFLRVLRFIPHADQLWAGIGRALRASVGLILAIIFYLTVMGLIASHLFVDVAPTHFDDPFTSIYTIFKVFTIEGWFEVPDAIAAAHGPMMGFAARAFFTFTIVTGGLVGMSIINAVFVDEMVMDNNDLLEERIAALTIELEMMRDEQLGLLRTMSAQLGALSTPAAPPPAPGVNPAGDAQTD